MIPRFRQHEHANPDRAGDLHEIPVAGNFQMHDVHDASLATLVAHTRWACGHAKLLQYCPQRGTYIAQDMPFAARYCAQRGTHIAQDMLHAAVIVEHLHMRNASLAMPVPHMGPNRVHQILIAQDALLAARRLLPAVLPERLHGNR